MMDLERKCDALQSATTLSLLRSCHRRGGPKHEGPELPDNLGGCLETGPWWQSHLASQTIEKSMQIVACESYFALDKQRLLAV
jgi:hypothetical protein